jgi:tetratricopeptide (TPR) repeat protein
VEGNVAEADRPVLMARTASSLAGLLAEANVEMEWRCIRPDLPHFRAVAKSCSELPTRTENASFAAACADLYCQLGIYHFEHGELDEAENRLAASLRIIDAGGSPEGQEESRKPFVLRTLGEVKEQRGDFHNALACVRTALRMMQKQYGKCDPRLSDYYNSVGYVLKRRDYLDRAHPFYLRALAMSRQAHGECHADVAVCLNNMGGLFQAMGDLERALAYFYEALEINREVYGLRHAKVAIRLNNIGRVQTMLGRYDEALVNHNEALEIYEEAYGRNHPDVAASYLLIADALKGGDPEGSIHQIHEYARQAEQILSRFYEAGHTHRVWARNLMAYRGASPPEVQKAE